jgi:hypothetical protein
MKVVVRVDSTASGWDVHYSDPDDAAWQPAARSLESSAEREFPLPPVEEIGALAAEFTNLLVAPGVEAMTLRTLRRKCLAGDPAKGEAARLGGYLHAALFGPLWAVIEARGGRESLEIGLEIAVGDTASAGLPWELMHAPAQGLVPLAALPSRQIALVRLVPGAQRDHPVPELPLRVLFVVGRLLDSALRPGAEYLGLLRRLGIATAGVAGNARISLRLLTETTTDELETAVQEFDPHVVHFICHGDLEPNGARLLLTKRERDDPASKKTNAADPCDGPRLLGLLGRQNAFPCAVILNACHTADATATEAAGSLATQLIGGGVPVVIGMTGEVADGACRLFTRGFYEALLAGTSLPLAAARARRSAMLHYKNYDVNVEWSRLVFFARDWAATQLALNKPATGAARVAVAAAGYLPMHGRTICDRIEGVRSYEVFRDALAAGRAQRVLAFGVVAKAAQSSDQFSKTMLLDTIAVQAVFDGFIPCKLESVSKDPPANLLEFALKLSPELNAARKRFGLPPAAESDVLKLALRGSGHQLPPPGAAPFEVVLSMNELRSKVRNLPAANPTLSADAVNTALSTDFGYLRADIRAAFGVERRPLVLIDDLHRYEGVAEQFLDEIIGSKDSPLHDGAQPVPLIFSYSQHEKNGEEAPEAKTIKSFMGKKAGLVLQIELGPIGSLDEQRLAYSQYLLTRTPPLAINASRDLRKHADFLFDIACRTIEGVPSRFDAVALKAPVESSLSLNILVIADDEKILAEFP